MPRKRKGLAIGRSTPNAKRMRLGRRANENQPPDVAEAVDDHIVNTNEDALPTIATDLPDLPRPMVTLPPTAPVVTTVLPADTDLPDLPRPTVAIPPTAPVVTTVLAADTDLPDLPRPTVAIPPTAPVVTTVLPADTDLPDLPRPTVAIPPTAPAVTTILPAALSYTPEGFRVTSHVGNMTVLCEHCQATKFPGETKAMCCSNGKVDLNPLPPPPEDIRDLYLGHSPESEHFLSNLRKYNCAFQMTSFGCNEVTLRGWNPTFRVQGQVCHLIGSLIPAPNETARFLQVYFIDGEMTQLNTRMSITDGLRLHLVNRIQDVLMESNVYIRELKTVMEFGRRNHIDNFSIAIHESRRPLGEHQRRFNAPETNEVAILMPTDPVGQRDIVLHLRDDSLKQICELHPAYDALQYPLLFPRGTNGWSLQLKLTSRHKITQLQYYCFHFFQRNDNYLILARRLFQQYMVDAYAKIETERLGFLRREQGRLRADSYGALRDTLIAGDGDPADVGQRVILPATFNGGPRYMFERQQDAMTYVRHYGRPDLFITMTTNPKWPEIQNHLKQGQKAHDRPDLTVRVFRLKLQKLLDYLKNGVFGDLQAWLYSVEFQKRGLPHAHILLWLTRESKIVPEHYDRTVCAEIPNKDIDPDLHAIVTTQMIHGPCEHNTAAPCMKNGMCSKSFPKPFVSDTELGADSYPKYRRRKPEDGGEVAVLRSVQGELTLTKTIDNRWVVPYNPWLLRQMNCHVNVEVCSSIKSIKYVLKYVHKGTDQATFQIQDNSRGDEIKSFVNARYIGSTEAAWRIFQMPMHERSPPVIQLAVHLENGQRVYFTEQTAAERAAAEPPVTTLTAFLQLCQRDTFAAMQLYVDIPRYYTWNNKVWSRRKRGKQVEGEEVFEANVIGRVYTVSPRQGECFYLRLLLHHVKGPKSFHDLKMYDGVLCVTYREACLMRGLLEDDRVHFLTLQEAAVSASPAALRNLLAIILTYCNPSDPLDLWFHHKTELSEDYIRMFGTADDRSENASLGALEDLVLGMGGRPLQDYGLPAPERAVVERAGLEYTRETAYDIAHLGDISARNTGLLTSDQLHIHNDFVSVALRGESGLYFLDAPGGCGKTFLIETILASIRCQSKIAIATASSGLAATLLTGGRTIHSTFKVPLDLTRTEQPVCSIKKGTALARLIQDCSAIVVDEAPMSNKIVFEALDRTLRDIRSTDLTMGGIATLLCGDFRQVLPVIRNGTRANVVNACLKKSLLWPHAKVYELRTNMRALMTGDAEAEQFADLLLSLGDGSLPVIEQPDTICLRRFGTAVKSVDELIESVYPSFQEHYQDTKWLMERAILAPLNDTVTDINAKMSNMAPGQPVIYSSINTAASEEEAVHYPPEFLNSIHLPGLPAHVLLIKVGMPVMLMRSLNPPRLMNGTRCIVTKAMTNIIEVAISTGPFSGEKHLIPRITLQPTDTMLPFTFQRKQFPLQVCFALTVNKSQGQTLQTVGLDLRTPVFSHGMLYVAVSRTGRSNSVFYLADNHRTRNVVYHEVLQ